MGFNISLVDLPNGWGGHLEVFVMDLFSVWGCVASHHLSNMQYVMILDIDIFIILKYYYYYSCFLNIHIKIQLLILRFEFWSFQKAFKIFAIKLPFYIIIKHVKNYIVLIT